MTAIHRPAASPLWPPTHRPAASPLRPPAHRPTASPLWPPTHCLRPCVLQDHGGVIVNITATLGNRGQALQVHAGSAKAAVGMTPLPRSAHLGSHWALCFHPRKPAVST